MIVFFCILQINQKHFEFDFDNTVLQTAVGSEINPPIPMAGEGTQQQQQQQQLEGRRHYASVSVITTHQLLTSPSISIPSTPHTHTHTLLLNPTVPASSVTMETEQELSPWTE